MEHKCCYSNCNEMLIEIFGPLHKIPKNDWRTKIWLKHCGLMESDVPFKGFICSKHFYTKDFIIRNSKQYITSESIPKSDPKICKCTENFIDDDCLEIIRSEKEKYKHHPPVPSPVEFKSIIPMMYQKQLNNMKTQKEKNVSNPEEKPVKSSTKSEKIILNFNIIKKTKRKQVSTEKYLIDKDTGDLKPKKLPPRKPFSPSTFIPNFVFKKDKNVKTYSRKPVPVITDLTSQQNIDKSTQFNTTTSVNYLSTSSHILPEIAKSEYKISEYETITSSGTPTIMTTTLANSIISHQNDICENNNNKVLINYDDNTIKGEIIDSNANSNQRFDKIENKLCELKAFEKSQIQSLENLNCSKNDILDLQILNIKKEMNVDSAVLNHIKKEMDVDADTFNIKKEVDWEMENYHNIKKEIEIDS